MKVDRPSTIYKYESYNTRSLVNLKSQSLFFGSPRDFSDPYDCAITATVVDPSDDEIEVVRQCYLCDPSLSPLSKSQLESISFDELRAQLINAANNDVADMRENFLSTIGVTCFSECNDDLLMWAHYGGQYKGFCLAFNTAKEPFTKLRQVCYVDAIPPIDIVDLTVNKNYDKLLDELYCTKSISWEHEKEWRAIHAKAETAIVYETDALQAIYFGPDIDRLTLEIVCLIIQSQNPNVQFFEGKRSETEFRVEFKNFIYTSDAEAKHNALV